LAGIVASSVATTAVTDGANKFKVKLYKAKRAVGAVATVVKVPPAAVAVVVPTPTVGAAAYPKPAFVMVKLVICPLLPILAVAAGQHPAGKAKVAFPVEKDKVGGTE
jgi:hypothetical protein